MVPFRPFLVLGPLQQKPTTNKGTLTKICLLGYQEYILCLGLGDLDHQGDTSKVQALRTHRVKHIQAALHCFAAILDDDAESVVTWGTFDPELEGEEEEEEEEEEEQEEEEEDEEEEEEEEDFLVFAPRKALRTH